MTATRLPSEANVHAARVDPLAAAKNHKIVVFDVFYDRFSRRSFLCGSHSGFPPHIVSVGVWLGSVAEDTSFIVGVVQLCAEGINSTASSQEHLRGDEHPQSWRSEVEPDCMPVAQMQRWSKASGRIHAHPGKRRFEGYENRVQQTNQVRCVAA